jgi:hypothetical protein
MSRPRRNRFRATIANRDGSTRQIDLLVYGGKDEALALAEVKGFRVLECLSADELKAAGGFRIDRAALREACEFLGITGNVEVRFNARAGRTNGNYRRRYGKHDIMVKSYLTPAEASKTLWHELAHAMQAERVEAEGGEWGTHSRAQRRWSYSVRPIEVEARSYEQYAEALPLAV